MCLLRGVGRVGCWRIRSRWRLSVLVFLVVWVCMFRLWLWCLCRWFFCFWVVFACCCVEVIVVVDFFDFYVFVFAVFSFLECFLYVWW